MSESESSSASEPPELAAWRGFCRRMESLGEEVLKSPYPATAADGPEALAHLADQVACWLGFVTGHSDPAAPFFHRSNDLVTQWGGPNQDNSYKHARIDPKRRYRIRGKMHSCEEFALTLRVDFMHMPEWGTRASLSSSDRSIGPGDDFEILLGGDGSDPEWLQIPEDVTTVSLREYYIDWQPAEPAIFTIECLDEVAPPERITGPQVAARLERAQALTERSITYWNDYMLEHRSTGKDNEFALPMKLAKGFSSARYAFCFFELTPDEALYIETDVPDARYWGLQLANLGWFEQIDPVNRITTINQHQAHVDGDGRLRMVVAHEDPGVPNWLDTGGHHDGLLTFRWFWPKSDPSPTTRVVKRSDVQALMPPDSAAVDSEARRAEVRARKAHLAWRFRT